jgi:hypothetical protein
MIIIPVPIELRAIGFTMVIKFTIFLFLISLKFTKNILEI